MILGFCVSQLTTDGGLGTLTLTKKRGREAGAGRRPDATVNLSLKDMLALRDQLDAAIEKAEATGNDRVRASTSHEINRVFADFSKKRKV